MDLPTCRIKVLFAQEEMALFMVERWAELCRRAVHEKGFFVAALSGGETPLPFYRKLAEKKGALPWAQTHLFWTDERFVPRDHPDSNYRLLKDILLDHIPIPAKNVHPVPAEEATVEAASLKYEQEIRGFFRLTEKIPVFDLILLGIGEDGHTASLFPGGPGLASTDRLAVAVPPDGIRHARVSFTLAAINRTREVVFLAAGTSKAAVIKRVVQEHDRILPASGVAPEAGVLWFLLDREAAAKLSPMDTGPTGCGRPE